MLFYSGTLTEEVTKDKNYQEKMELFAQRTGIRLTPHFLSPGKPVSVSNLNTSDILEADIRVLSTEYNFDYLPGEDEMQAILYPLFICRWHTTSTHYTKRSGWKNYELIYTHSGSGILNMDNHIYYLRPDSLCLLNCRPYHYYFAADERGWEYSFIHFDGPSAAFLYSEIAKKGFVFQNLKNTLIFRKYDDLVTLAKRNPEDFDLQFHLCLTSLLVELACSSPVQPEMIMPRWLSHIQAYIIENYSKDWTICDLSQRACLSESRFAHVFKEYMGTSPIDYRDYLRIEHAKDFLKNSQLSIEKIAEATGFSTIPGFYAAFSKHAGTTPGKYRRRTQAKKEAVFPAPENQFDNPPSLL